MRCSFLHTMSVSRLSALLLTEGQTERNERYEHG